MITFAFVVLVVQFVVSGTYNRDHNVLELFDMLPFFLLPQIKRRVINKERMILISNKNYVY